MVTSAEFNSNLWDCRTNPKRNERYETYERYVESMSFYRNVRDLHKIFYHISCYLRHFDSDRGKIHKVLPKAVALELNMKGMPITELITTERNLEVIAVFQARKTGIRTSLTSKMKVPLLQDIYFAVHLLDPCGSPVNDAPFRMRLHRHITQYMAGMGSHDDVEPLRIKLFQGYMQVRGIWATESCRRDYARFITDKSSNPLMWWDTMMTCCPEFSEIFEFAQLCCSPSSRAAGRSFC